MKKNKTLLLFIILLAGMSIMSCKKDSKTEPDTPTPSNGTVMLHLHTNVDTNEVDTYGQVYVIANGRKISVNIAQLYISGIELVKADGSTYSISNLNVLKVMEAEEYELGSVPSGNYKSIRFNVGLSAATNSTTPASNDSTLNKPGMWFGSTAQPSGFVFVNFQGTIDTSAAANLPASQMQPFKYRIGTNAHLASVSMPNQNYSVVPNQASFIHIVIDYSQLFNGIQLNNASNLMVNSTADNAGPLATQVANNIPSMFSYEN